MVPRKERSRKEDEDRGGGKLLLELSLQRKALKYLQAGNSTDDACCSWSL